MDHSLVNRAVAAIAAFHIITFGYFLAFVIYNGYLPQPFSYDSSDTFMDFFHTNYWAHQDGRYTEWGSIYPIFTFFIAQIISPSECYRLDAFAGRDCDNISLYVLWAFSLLGAYFNARLFFRERLNRWLCFLAIVLSFPFLMAVERGNYILLAYTFLVFAASSRSQKVEGFFLACAINLKQYLLVLLGYALLNRQYGVLAGVLVSTIMLNVMGILFLPEPKVFRLLTNMTLFVDPDLVGLFGRLAYSISVNSFISFSNVPRVAFVFEALRAEYLLVFARILEYVVVAMVSFVAYRLAKIGHKLEKGYVFYVILVCLFNLTDTPGIYALILFLPYLPMAYPRLSKGELITLFVLFLPVDASFYDTHEYIDGLSYITGEIVTHSYGLMYGSVYRPLAMLLLLVFVVLRVARSMTVSKTTEYQRQSGFALRPT